MCWQLATLKKGEKWNQIDPSIHVLNQPRWMVHSENEIKTEWKWNKNIHIFFPLVLNGKAFP